MSRVANPYDNAHAESFVATFKAEAWSGAPPATRVQGVLRCFEYIEVFYNRARRHSALGYRSPEEFEAQFGTGPTPAEGCAEGGRRRGESGPSTPLGDNPETTPPSLHPHH